MTNSTNSYKISHANRSINDYFKTSYSRAHYYENLIDQPVQHVRVERKIPEDLKIQENSIVPNITKSVYNDTFDIKYRDYCRSSDDYGRSSTVSKPSLKSLHEKYTKQPVMPLNVYQTTTGTTYAPPEEIHTPLRSPNKSPIEGATCSIHALTADESPAIPINEIGYYKHLDPFVSTTQLTHMRFTPNQQNGVAKKDIITYYDAAGAPKVRGFGPKKMIPIGPYFHRDEVTSNRVQPKRLCRELSMRNNTSSYKAHFDHVSTNLTYWDPQICFYPIFQASNFDILAVPAMYRTEYCHVGTGRSSRAVVDIGRTQGCF